MRTIKKAIAMLGSIAAVAALSATALNALAFDPVNPDDRASEFKSGVTNLIADEVYAEPGETVSYRVMIRENAGYASSGFVLDYDARLKAVAVDNDATKPVIQYGDGCKELGKTSDLNQPEHIVGFGTMGEENCTLNGVVYTVQFVVPSDAKDGDQFDLSLKVEKFLDEKTDEVAHNDVNGWIRIKIPEQTTVSSTTVGTVPTTSVTVSQTESVPTEPVTTSTSVSQSVTTVTTTLTTASRQNAGTETTKKPATSGTNTTAAKTGDAGVGIATAALLLSGVTAVVCTRKKEH